jgi:hypothetical protein
MPLSEARKERLRVWHLEVRLPASSDRPHILMRQFLKSMLRRWNIRCVAIRDSNPHERVSS